MSELDFLNIQQLVLPKYDHPDFFKIYYQINKETILKKQKEYRQKTVPEVMECEICRGRFQKRVLKQHQNSMKHVLAVSEQRK